MTWAVTSFLAVLSAAIPQIEIDQVPACIDPASLEAALESSIEPEADIEHLRLKVMIIPRTEHGRRSADHLLRLSLHGHADKLLLKRELDIALGDCPDLPALIAVIVSRRLEELPRQQWASPLRAPVRIDLPGGAEPAHSKPRSTLELTFNAHLGAGVALRDPLPSPFFAAQGELGRARWPRLVVATRAELRSVQVAATSVQIFGLRGGLGLGYDLNLRAIAVSPQLLLAAGLQVVNGFGPSGASRQLLPLLGAQAQLALHTRRGIYLAVGVEIPFVLLRLHEAGSIERYDEPAVRYFGAIGFEWSFER